MSCWPCIKSHEKCNSPDDCYTCWTSSKNRNVSGRAFFICWLWTAVHWESPPTRHWAEFDYFQSTNAYWDSVEEAWSQKRASGVWDLPSWAILLLKGQPSWCQVKGNLRSGFLFEATRSSGVVRWTAGTTVMPGNFHGSWKQDLVFLFFTSSYTLHKRVNSYTSTLLSELLKATERFEHALLLCSSKLWASSGNWITLSHKPQRRGPVCIYWWGQAATDCDLAHETFNNHFNHSHCTASNSIRCLSMNFSGLITSNHGQLEYVN